MNDKLKPALMGGAIAGVLSVIPIVSVCFCIWAIGGGFLGSYLYIKQSQTPVTAGGGATTGALAGVVGAVIYFAVQLIIVLIFGTFAGLDEAIRRSGTELPFSGVVLALIGIIIGVILIIGLATVGGLIAVPVFEKRKDGMAPPPPQSGFGV